MGWVGIDTLCGMKMLIPWDEVGQVDGHCPRASVSLLGVGDSWNQAAV